MAKESVPLVGALVTGLTLLETLAHGPAEGMTLTEIANQLRMHKSTVLRFLVTLEHEGYVEQNPTTMAYRLRLKMFCLGSEALSRRELVREAQPLLDELADQTGETVHLAVLDEGEVVYVAKVMSQHAFNIYSRIGRRAPAHCTGLGKAMIAYLPEEALDRLIAERGLKRFTERTITDPEALKAHLAEIRTRGIAFDNEEHEPGVRCVAAPVRDYTGKVVAALSVTAPTVRFTDRRMQEMVAPVQEAARRLSEQMGYYQNL